MPRGPPRESHRRAVRAVERPVGPRPWASWRDAATRKIPAGSPFASSYIGATTSRQLRSAGRSSVHAYPSSAASNFTPQAPVMRSSFKFALYYWKSRHPQKTKIISRIHAYSRRTMAIIATFLASYHRCPVITHLPLLYSRSRRLMPIAGAATRSPGSALPADAIERQSSLRTGDRGGGLPNRNGA